ncbi:MAG: biotin/lipoyl-containing protein [Chitinophagales bacterium]
MAIVELSIPKISEFVTEVKVTLFLVETGDTVELDQALLDFDSDKATYELCSPVAGVVNFTVEKGQSLRIGDVVGFIDSNVAEST